MSEKTSPRPLAELDKGTREEIERITALQPHELNDRDRAFMYARRDYLTEAQIADYAKAEEAGGDDESYATWTLADLKAEAEARGLTVVSEGNKKAPWVAALEADDANNPE